MCKQRPERKYTWKLKRILLLNFDCFDLLKGLIFELSKLHSRQSNYCFTDGNFKITDAVKISKDHIGLIVWGSIRHKIAKMKLMRTLRDTEQLPKTYVVSIYSQNDFKGVVKAVFSLGYDPC